ncbi:hypothetical protein BLNAU_5725 [Blattamonas nauphoetae]|uniref:Uncharacterized protein n=1 Tax=Blattamonas nauphoetae TaxID=2049346 RepID=A0ABQ9Y6Q6_9EUKA|nr:hypothetical protein BLNAU_5725 [Blattamonas nauphoetae]
MIPPPPPPAAPPAPAASTNQGPVVFKPGPLDMKGIPFPELLMSDPCLFDVSEETVIRTKIGRSKEGFASRASFALKEPFTSGVTSLTFTVPVVGATDTFYGSVNVAILPSNVIVPPLRKYIASPLNACTLHYSDGKLAATIRQNATEPETLACHSPLEEGDIIRVEVDMDSTPRVAQFFVNGKAGSAYVSHLPSSVRLAWQANLHQTRVRLLDISKLTHATPIPKNAKELKLNQILTFL